MSGYVIAGGGWNGVSANGDKFVRVKMKCSIGEGTVLTMYKNKKKSKVEQPDYLLFMIPDQEKPDKEGLF